MSQAPVRSFIYPLKGRACHFLQAQTVLMAFLLLLASAPHAAEGNVFGSSIDFAMYRLATEQNDASAQYLVGNNYLRGKTVNKDYFEAIQWFEKAARQGHRKAQYQLGKMYLYGTGIDVNYPFAYDFLKKAADNRHAQAQFELGNYFKMGGSGVVEYTTAITWYRLAAGQRHRKAMLELGKLLYEKRGEEKSPGEAMKMLQNAADSGVHEASKYLRKIKNGSIQIAKSAPAPVAKKNKATNSFAKLTPAGSTPGLTAVIQSSSVSRDQGNSPESRYRLAMTYLNGDGVDKDPVIAARLMRKAADNKHAGAQYQLSLLYKEGIGVEKSENDAEIWLTHAAQNGLEKAKQALEKSDSNKGKISSETLALGETQYRLGLNFLNGSGGMQDSVLAARWLIKAAKQDHGPAKYQLGLMYRDGIGVAMSKKTAARWFQAAASQGEARAVAALQTVNDPAPTRQVASTVTTSQSREFTGRQNPDVSSPSRIVVNNVVNHKPLRQPAGNSLASVSTGTPNNNGNQVTSSRNNIKLASRNNKNTQRRPTPRAALDSPLAQAAQRGDAEAQYKLGMNYIQGSSVDRNIDLGMEWISKAADNRHLDAQLHIASMYLNGDHKVTRDVSKAVKWYERAAESGDADAQFNLGEMYKKGIGLDKDNSKAIKWYRKAANQGHKKARNRMGGCRIC